MCVSSTAAFCAGVVVNITEGTFSGMQGRVLGVTREGLVRVDVLIFGRPVAVELHACLVEGDPMSEEEYLACCNVPRLVSVLCHSVVAAHARLARLFGCACLRLGWESIPVPLRHWVEVAERLADNSLEAEEWQAVLQRLMRKSRGSDGGALQELAAYVDAVLESDWSVWTAWASVHHFRRADLVCPGRILHDIFGNPFRPPTVDARWLTWNRGLLPRLAREIYDDRRFHEMPVLSDALEDAGCADEAILAHCRSPGPHVRGCWVLDALLGFRGYRPPLNGRLLSTMGA